MAGWAFDTEMEPPPNKMGSAFNPSRVVPSVSRTVKLRI